MAVLTRDEILRKIDNGEIIIEPFEKNRVGPASIDLTLDTKFRVKVSRYHLGGDVVSTPRDVLQEEILLPSKS